MRYFDGTLRRTELKEYDVSCFPTAEGISALIGDVKHYAPASRYAMIVSCHGMGWLPITSSKSRMMDNQKDYWEYEGVPLTRYFGGLSAEYQTEIPTFAKGIKMSGTYMEYILFDDCYMSNIEVAYDLKDVADYLIASPTEVMAFGFPYAELGEYLLGDIDYRTIVDEFYNFYSSYQYPYGTIGVTDLSQVEQMARVMREINTNYDDTNVNVNSVQRMDGYSPVIFFDFGAYINSLCGGSQLASDFYTQLNHLTPFAAHTKSFYSMSRGAIYVDEYSGITISDISINSKAVSKTETAWYKATH